MKTAVEYIQDNLSLNKTLGEIKIIIATAKEMDKQQTIEFAENWSKQILRSDRSTNIEQYYNETFKE